MSGFGMGAEMPSVAKGVENESKEAELKKLTDKMNAEGLVRAWKSNEVFKGEWQIKYPDADTYEEALVLAMNDAAQNEDVAEAAREMYTNSIARPAIANLAAEVDAAQSDVVGDSVDLKPYAKPKNSDEALLDEFNRM